MNKEQVHSTCIGLVDDHLKELESRSKELEESLLSDTKSTAGDKHETARAMTHLEQEKLQGQLAQWQAHRRVLVQIGMKPMETIAAGSLVGTNKGWFYISASLGRVEVEGQQVFALSAQSPLGQQLLGKRKGAEVAINGVQYRVESVA